MTFTILYHLFIFGWIASIRGASMDTSTVQTNDSTGETSNNVTEPAGRSGRKYYDDPQLYVTVPAGYYVADEQGQQQSKTETNHYQNSRHSIPKSFDEFVPGGVGSRNDYPVHYYTGGKGGFFEGGSPPVQIGGWKGDTGNDGLSSPWIPQSPADVMTLMNIMKNMNVDGSSGPTDDQPTGLLSKLTSEPLVLFLAAVLPFTILLAAALPAIELAIKNGGAANIPTVTTVASGKTGRSLGEQPSFAKPILEIIESFSGRSSGEHPCIQKTFCEITKGSNSKDLRTVQRSIYNTFTFLDDYWLEKIGMKELMVAMDTGNCDRIQCNTRKVNNHERNSK